ncbi:aminoglycoside phosphotransferase family protein, partial [Escherichia coli]|uniref:aminoglycoside phosphotransferase family protein n=1 Tax=Escherichia coli TaxID=562 RepID=UPI000AF42A12
VKGLKPIEDIADELRGADYLVWRNGRGAVRLLGRENNLMLLEYAGERMLSHIVAEHGDYQATEIAAELMAKLYAASEEPLPSALLPIRDRFAALFQRARDDQNAGCQTDYVHAAIIADQMMSNASELRGLHGDLHHENIMFSSHGLPFLGAEVRPKGVQAVMNGGGRVFGGQVDHRAGGQFAHLQQIRPACNLCGQLQGQHGFTGTVAKLAMRQPF